MDELRATVTERDRALTRLRVLTRGAVALALLLAGAFAGLAAAGTPGRKLSGQARTTTATPKRVVHESIPTPVPQPAPSSAAPAAPAPAPPAQPPAPSSAPPVAVSGGS